MRGWLRQYWDERWRSTGGPGATPLLLSRLHVSLSGPRPRGLVLLCSPHTRQEDCDDWGAAVVTCDCSDRAPLTLCSPHTGQEDWDDWGGASGGSAGGSGLGSVSSHPHAPAARSGSEYSLSQLQVGLFGCLHSAQVAAL